MKLFALIFAVLLVDRFCSSDAFLFCHTPSTSSESWSNHWDQEFTFKCPKGKSLTEIHSLYSSCHQDRVFRFACRRNAAASERCHWSPWVNEYDKLVSYKCPHSGFITGIRSRHSNLHGDRKFMFRCCHTHGLHPVHCTYGRGFVNEWRGNIDFKTPKNNFLVAATSNHKNFIEDRRWKFEYCQVAGLHEQY